MELHSETKKSFLDDEVTVSLNLKYLEVYLHQLLIILVNENELRFELKKSPLNSNRPTTLFINGCKWRNTRRKFEVKVTAK